MIELKNVNYPEKNPVLKNITLSFREGEITGIAGRAGSGKSTLLKLLSLHRRDLARTSGTILLENRETGLFSKSELRRKIHLSKNALPGNMDEPLYNFLLLARIPYKPFMKPFHEYDLQVVDTFMGRFNLGHLRKKPLRELSDSLLQRSLLAFSFISEADLMLFDNPTQNLDLESMKILYREMARTVMDGNRAMVIASHDINLMTQVADRIIIIDEGKVAEQGMPEMIDNEMIRKYFSTDVFLSRNIYNGRPVINMFPDN